MTHEAGNHVIAKTLAAAKSVDCRERAAAGRRLAAYADTADIVPILRELLLDADDTFVTVETAESLLMRADVPGTRLVCWALEAADDELTHHWLVDAIVGQCMQTEDDLQRARGLVERLYADDDPTVRAGAQRFRWLLDHYPEDPPFP